ncbi:hypothetical protein F1D61_16280 [Methylobacterium aquaticum]|nr:hypothetical protein F1D61_16280 [Methylobacterium aquaticum]
MTRHRRWPPPRETPPATALWRARRRDLPLSSSYTTPRDTTRWKTPFQTICQAWTKDQDRFKSDPHHLIPGPNI